MPTVIDSLIVELGLDPSKFTTEAKGIAGRLAGFKSQTQQGAKEIENQIKVIADAFDSMAKKAVGYVAGFLTVRSLASFADQIVQTNRQLGIMADTTQETVARLSALGNVFERMGGSAEGIMNVLADWDTQQKSMDAFILNPMDSSLLKFLNELSQLNVSVSSRDAQGKWKKPFDLLVEVAEKVSKSGADPSLITAHFLKAGFDRETIAALMRGGAAMSEHLKKQKEINVVTDEQRKKTDELWRSWMEVSQRIKNIGQVVLENLADGLIKVADAINKVLDVVNKGLSDPNSIFYVPSIANIKKFLGIGTSFPSTGMVGKYDAFGNPVRDTGDHPAVSGKGAMGGSVHGHAVDPYGGLTGKELYEPMSGWMGGGVGGTSAKFGAGQHEGVDIMGPRGSPVYASRAGTIITAPSPNGGIDQVLTIDHGDGTYSRYLHQGPANVKVGDRVSGGQMIGSSGHRNADHTHFEMWKGRPGAGGSALINPKALYGWDKANPAVGGRKVIGHGPDDGPAKAAQGGQWGASAEPMPFMNFKSPISLRAPSVINNSRTDISSVNVNSQADDAAAIAGDIAKELKRQMRDAAADQQQAGQWQP